MTGRLDELLHTTSKHLKKLQMLGINTIKDFLLYFPRNHADTSTFTKIADIELGKTCTIKGKISSLFNIRTKFGKTITKGVFFDDTGTIDVVWFNQAYLFKLLPRKKDIILTGKVKYSFRKIALQSPSHEIIKPYEEQIHTGRIVPVYHETEGLTSKWIREKLKPLINEWIGIFEEYLPQNIISGEKLLDYKTAIKNIHFPESMQLLEQARYRLAFDELFLLQ
ncbi:DNA helicase RecG, partial [Candidatus Peregrinibacteria bacterium]|nr:DNA helicase RecG [Candidatus Peregrinibacteria bacterium]